jgi:hypothetical protein
MPGIGPTVAIGGGINAGAPFALDNFLYVSNVNPPAASSYPGLVRGTNAVEAPGTQTARANQNTVIGPNNTVTNANTTRLVMIGSGLSAGTGSSPVNCYINIGQDNTTPNQTDVIVIGGGNNDGGSQGAIKIGRGMSGLHNNVTAIGISVTLGGASNGVVIGSGASTSGGGNNAVVIGGGAAGQTNVAIVGQGTNGMLQNVAALGPGTSIGGGGSSNDVLIGCNLSPQGAPVNDAVTVGNGAEIRSGFIVLGNNNLGSGGFSGTVLWGGADLHTNNVAVPAWFERWKNAQGNNIAAGDLTYTAPLATGNAASANVVFQTGLVGGAGAALQVATNVLRLTNAQKVEISQDNGLSFPAATSGAGAAVGTLNNAPAAGDPTHWLRVVIGGVNKFIPAW